MIIVIDDSGPLAAAIIVLALAIAYRIYVRWQDRLDASRGSA